MLPIALKSFRIKKYRGIIDTQIDNIPPDTQWIFLTGENGFGKTSLLRAIAKGLIGDEEKVTQIDFNSKIVSSIVENNGVIFILLKDS